MKTIYFVVVVVLLVSSVKESFCKRVDHRRLQNPTLPNIVRQNQLERTPAVYLREADEQLGPSKSGNPFNVLPHQLHARVKRNSLHISNANITQWFNQNKWGYAVVIIGAVIVIAVIVAVIVSIVLYIRYVCRKDNMGDSNEGDHCSELSQSSDWDQGRPISTTHHRDIEPLKRPLSDDLPPDRAVSFFLKSSKSQYSFDEKLDDLGSRVQKHWYVVQRSASDQHSQELMILTVAPVSSSCPLKLDKHKKGLNQLLAAVSVHPFLNPIYKVKYLIDHQFLVMVQPYRESGSLKDFIYRAHPKSNWSMKYARRSKGLSPDEVKRFGRQILEAMLFLYDKGFPDPLGHVQCGNVFVVDDVCLVGGYENTLLGYKTRLYTRCRDNPSTIDTIMFGHLVFEMAAGYELTDLTPREADYKTVHKKVKPILQYIFEVGVAHTISEIRHHDFFAPDELLPELKHFNPEQVKLTDNNIKEVLAKVHKGKPRVQKAPKAFPPSLDASQTSAESKKSWLQENIGNIRDKLAKFNPFTKTSEKPYMRNNANIEASERLVDMNGTGQ